MPTDRAGDDRADRGPGERGPGERGPSAGRPRDPGPGDQEPDGHTRSEQPVDRSRGGSASADPDAQPTPANPATPAVDPAKALLAQARADARVRGRGGGRRRERRTDAGGRSGAAPDDRDPQLFATALTRLLAEHGWEVDVAVHAVMARWAELVGSEVAAHCTPERYADGELTVRTDSTAWATQLRLLAPRLVQRLNVELGDGTVRFVHVQGPDAPRWTHGPRSVRGRGPRDTYG